MVSKDARAIEVRLLLQNQADCDRLEQLLLEISRNIETPIETDQPDPEWLTGTGADEHKKVTIVFFLSIQTDRSEQPV